MVQCLDITTLRLYLYSRSAINEQQSAQLEIVTSKEEAMLKVIQFLQQNCRLDPARRFLEVLTDMQSSWSGSEAVQELIVTLEQQLDALCGKVTIHTISPLIIIYHNIINNNNNNFIISHKNYVVNPG